MLKDINPFNLGSPTIKVDFYHQNNYVKHAVKHML